ncbi:MAG TPA: TonB family protein [Pyrinomonadaceae bacterium]|nr:TonB family protein [Pyrinomonadaceae bacterium]
MLLAAAAAPARQTAAQPAEASEADDLDRQAIELYREGKFDDALRRAERAVALRRPAPGPDGALLANSLGNLAELLYVKRKYKEAEAALREQLAIYEKVPRGREERMAGALNRLVCLLNARGRWDDLLDAQKRLFKVDNGFEFDPSMTPRSKAEQARGGLIGGRVKAQPRPRYPVEARAARVTGAVVLKVTVDEAGAVEAVTPLCGPPPLARGAAESASQARYEPLVVGGKPVKFTGVVIYRYTLQ